MKEEKWGTWINVRCNRFLSSKGTGKEETRWGKIGDNNEMGKVVKQDKEEEEGWWYCDLHRACSCKGASVYYGPV